VFVINYYVYKFLLPYLGDLFRVVAAAVSFSQTHTLFISQSYFQQEKFSGCFHDAPNMFNLNVLFQDDATNVNNTLVIEHTIPWHDYLREKMYFDRGNLNHINVAL
jgi:hypothetical protein